MIKIAINGFGRIGRSFLRSILSDSAAREKIKVVAINLGPCNTDGLDILFKYDTTMGTFSGPVSIDSNYLVIGETRILLVQISDSAGLSWLDLDLDWVVDCSGNFTEFQKAKIHLSAGAKNVLISAPAQAPIKTIILGVNSQNYDPSTDRIVSLGSCTTNCLAPIIKVILDNGGLESACMTTVHAYTSDQRLLDNAHSDPRRARCAGANIIPAKTGVDRSICAVFPELDGKFKAFSLRVPVPKVSIIDLTFFTDFQASVEFWNERLIQASAGPMRGILECVACPLVSSDYCGNTHSSIVDLAMTQVFGKTNKIFAWYDNEAGYACRLKDFLMQSV